MKKEIHPKMQDTHFTCASCNSKFTVTSTLVLADIAIDICSQCHPFYIGSSSQQSVKGRAEKLSSKFAAGKETITHGPKSDKVSKKDPKANTQKPKTLADL